MFVAEPERYMGCVQGKYTSTNSPPEGVQKLKDEYDYAKRSGNDHQVQKDVGMANGGGQKEGEAVRNGGTNGNMVSKKIGGDDLVNGWPKWLVDNISTEFLAGLVLKSADSYDKLDKVYIYKFIYAY